MAERGWDRLAIGTIATFAWATAGGRSYIDTFDITGVATLLYSAERVEVLTSNVEMPRLEQDELDGLPVEYRVIDWTDMFFNGPARIREAAGPGVLAADIPIDGAVPADGLTDLRAALVPEEVARMLALAADTAAALEQAARSLESGQTEERIAADVRARLGDRGVLSPVTLVATDQRIYDHRHPLPTEKTLDRYAMLVTSSVRHGLWCSMTRLVHFGEPPAELVAKAQACAEVDAAYIAATTVGRTAVDIFAAGRAEYAARGFPDEWKLHHQGGAAGYGSREYFVGGGHPHPVLADQCFAWNPSIAGVKSEDTVLATAAGPEVLTATGDWPVLATERGIDRPAILVR